MLMVQNFDEEKSHPPVSFTEKKSNSKLNKTIIYASETTTKSLRRSKSDPEVSKTFQKPITRVADAVEKAEKTDGWSRFSKILKPIREAWKIIRRVMSFVKILSLYISICIALVIRILIISSLLGFLFYRLTCPILSHSPICTIPYFQPFCPTEMCNLITPFSSIDPEINIRI